MHNADNYTLRHYGQMINDTARTEPFIEALRQAIVPGKSDVLDIGTSFGFFAFMACKLGAAKVFAVEPDNAIEAAKLCAKNSPYSDRITWIQGLSTKIDLPEKVDIVIADLHGPRLLFEGRELRCPERILAELEFLVTTEEPFRLRFSDFKATLAHQIATGATAKLGARAA